MYLFLKFVSLVVNPDTQQSCGRGTSAEGDTSGWQQEQCGRGVAGVWGGEQVNAGQTQAGVEARGEGETGQTQ